MIFSRRTLATTVARAAVVKNKNTASYIALVNRGFSTHTFVNEQQSDLQKQMNKASHRASEMGKEMNDYASEKLQQGMNRASEMKDEVKDKWNKSTNTGETIVDKAYQKGERVLDNVKEKMDASGGIKYDNKPTTSILSSKQHETGEVSREDSK
jgi:surface antigen